MNEVFYYFLVLFFSGYLTSLLFGIISLPIANFFFSNYKDSGFSASKIIGLFSTGFIYLTFVTISSFLPIHFLKLNSIYTFVFSVLIFIIFQAKFLNTKIVSQYKNLQIKNFIHTEIIFSIILGIFLFVNLTMRYDLASEHLMNMAIFKKIQTQEKLPLSDFWLSDFKLNYYFFGHLVFSQYQILNNFDNSVNYYLFSALIPALLGTSLYIFIKQFAQKYSFISLIILFGLTPIPSIYEYFNIPLSFGEKVFEVFKNNSVRPVIHAITENFSYSFLNIPVHAHVFSLLIGMLIIFQLRRIYDCKRFINLRDKNYQFLFILLGFSYLTNTWDFIFYLSILILIHFFEFFNLIKNNFKDFVFNLEALCFISIFISLPWFIFYKGPAIGINIVEASSSFLQFFSFWQVYVFILFAYLIIYYFKDIKKIDRFFVSLIFFSFIILTIMEFIYFMDATKQRWNTYYKFSNQILLLFSVVCSVYLSKILEFKNFGLLKFVLLFLISISASGPLIYYFYKFDDKFLSNFYTVNEKLFKLNSKNIEAFNFLNKQKVLNENENILEYSGFAYNAANIFSALSGFDSVMGWKNHEITWRLEKNIYEFIINRDNDIKEIYTGQNEELTTNLLKKYHVKYLIIGKIERDNFHNINLIKIKKMGSEIFSNSEVSIFKINNNL